MSGSLVMVVGPGRSGTSSMAGALAASGFHVPGAIKGNTTNPTGFFEPRWAVNLHKRLLTESGVGTLDPDPLARERLEAVNADAGVREEVRAWLEKSFGESDRLVLKDPRMIWFRQLWSDAAAELGVTPGFVVMLRHPAEVSASRSTYYSARDVAAVAGWINVALMSESATEGSPRRFVHYPDLLTDWRAELGGVAQALGLSYEPAIDQRPHPVDEHIDPNLRRMSSGWDGVAVPGVLSDLAERAFLALQRESQRPGSVTAEELAALRRDYAELYDFAEVMTLSRTRRTHAELKQRAARQARKRLRAELQAAPVAAKPGFLARLRGTGA